MTSLQKINAFLNRIMPIISPTSVVIGVLLSNHFSSYAYLVPWIFAFMTFQGSLGSDFKSLGRVVSHPFPIFIAMLVLHIIMPVWAWSVGHIVFHGDVFTIMGLVLAVVIPTGVTSYIWVNIYKGNLALALSIILIDTLLSPFIVPYSLALFVGKQVEMDVWGIMQGLMIMVVIPSILGMFLNQLTKGTVNKTLGTPLAPFSKLGLALVIMINSSTIAPYLTHVDMKLVSIAVIVFFISAYGYLFSWFIGKHLKWEKEEIIALTFTGGMRNISAGAVIAVTYFPAQVAVPVIIGVLFQQVLASFYGHMLDHSYKRLHGGLSTINKGL
jgi:predicted Na+-dependent transporter